MVILRATDNFGNQEVLDILNEGGLFCDISAIEAGDLGEVYGISSQEFIIPGTDKNNNFFGNSFDIGADPTVALNYTIYASVLVDSQEIFNGRLYINNVLTDDEGYTVYKAVVINETVDFKTRVTDIALSNLDLSQYDHTLNVTNVTASWYDGLFSGDIVYPLANYGTPTSGYIVEGFAGDNTFNNEPTPLTVDNLKPAIRTKAVIDAIFDLVDYNYSSSFIDSDYFNELYVIASPTDDGSIPGTSPASGSLIANTSGSVAQTILTNTTSAIKFENELVDPDNVYDTGNGEYRVPQDGRYEITLDLGLSWAAPQTPPAANRAIIRILVNGSLVQSKLIDTPSQNYRAYFNYTTTSLNASDVITIEVFTTKADYIGSSSTSAGETLTIIPMTQTQLRIEPSVVDNLEVNVAGMFSPDYSVKDFLTGLIQKFNLVIEPKKNERNTLIIEPFNTWRDSGDTKDWTDKVDHSVRKSIKGTMINQAHFVNFSDEEDEDFFNADYQDTYLKVFGEKLYMAGSDLTQGTKEIGTFFAPTPVAGVPGTNNFIIPQIFTREDGVGNQPTGFKPRLLYNCGRRTANQMLAYDTNGDVDGIGYYLANIDGGGVVKQTVYTLFHYLELEQDTEDYEPDLKTSRDLNFNNSDQAHYVPKSQQFNYRVERDAIYEYWAQYLNELYDPESKLVTLNILFDPSELQDIQLNDKIFIDGHYYRINNITNFPLTEKGSVQVELIKAPVRKFNFPRRRIYNIDGPNNGNTGTGFDGAGGGFTDLTVSDDGLNIDGTVTYVNVDDGLPPTGSGNQELVGRVASMDGYTYTPNDEAKANWDTAPIVDNGNTRGNSSLGNNDIAYDVTQVSVIGNGNIVRDKVKQTTIMGSNNEIESYAYNVTLYGDNNFVSSSANNIFVANANDIQIGNISSSVILNPTHDLTAEDSGRVIIGNAKLQGQQYETYVNVDVVPGGTYYLTGSTGTDLDFHHHFRYTGANGNAQVYIPSASLASDDGLKMRFTTDGNLTGARTVTLTPSDGTIDGSAEKTLITPHDGLTAQVINGNWIVIQEKTK